MPESDACRTPEPPPPTPDAVGGKVGTGSTPAADADPGTLLEQIDPAVRLLIERGILPVDHVAADGTPHLLPEDLDRIAADLLPPSAWGGAR